MKRYLLDSNALSHFIYRRKGVYERTMRERRSGAMIGTCTPVAGEILGGALYSDTWQTNVQRVRSGLAGVKIWPFELPAASEYARLYAELKRQGIVMQTIDRMIAAVALSMQNCTVVSCDSDFSRVPGLNVENWES
jgi:tRNA(fMet)-specific endonuclease VapC